MEDNEGDQAVGDNIAVSLQKKSSLTLRTNVSRRPNILVASNGTIKNILNLKRQRNTNPETMHN